MEGHAGWVTAVRPVMEGGRKVRAPLGRVLGNAQALDDRPDPSERRWGTESGTETYRPSRPGFPGVEG